jgi:hypothetical protein
MTCDTESVRTVGLVVPHGNVGDGDDTALWEITRRSGPPGGGPFTVGIAPSGFETVSPLKGPLPHDVTLAVWVSSDRVSGALEAFNAEDLRVGVYLVNDGRYLSYARLRTEAETSCGGQL